MTTDSKAITFEITPYECYDKEGGYLYYSAFVKPSDDGIYYWVGAVAYSSKGDAKSWIETDIQNHIDKGETWESLVKDKYIIQGNSKCGFEFDGADDMMFTAAAVEKTKKGIEIISDVSMSYPFYAINHGASKSLPATFDDFVGEWVCMPNGQYSRKEDNTLEVVESKPFNVTIAKSGSNTLTITGWGGDRNRFSSSPITIDYKNATDEIDEHFTITLHQDRGRDRMGIYFLVRIVINERRCYYESLSAIRQRVCSDSNAIMESRLPRLYREQEQDCHKD